MTPVQEIIKRHRLNLILHSYLYYWCDDPIWSDDKWQEVADQLVGLQAANPEPIGFYDEVFKDWTGATGMHLPRDGDIPSRALYLYRLNERMRNEEGYRIRRIED